MLLAGKLWCRLLVGKLLRRLLRQLPRLLKSFSLLLHLLYLHLLFMLQLLMLWKPLLLRVFLLLRNTRT